MIFNDRTIFTLNNSLAAISAVKRNEAITATDGQSRQILVFNADGVQTDCVSATRAYRRLRHINDIGYSALSCCESPDVYMLDSGFNEIARVTLDIPCDCAKRGINGIFDAELILRGGEIFITAAFAKGAYLFNKSGERLSRLCKADCGEMLTDFITLGEDSYAFATLCKGAQTVSVSENGCVYSGVLPRKYVLRMLFCENAKVYGLFGRNYLYNHIIPIYVNGILLLPQ